ncbi:hypothetical protein STA3757_31400 [Stanieria sp. NIES-3757]|nr:hypothetical protein STA3757_31400 [Stanieria sp. NIES-3757]
MSDRWKSLSLEEFFSYANWQGVVGQQDSSPLGVQPKSFSSWQSWKVEEFFSHANWQGRALTHETSQKANGTFALTLPVEQFFRYFVWEGKPKIAAFPLLKLNENVASVSNPTMNISNLTELF